MSYLPQMDRQQHHLSPVPDWVWRTLDKRITAAACARAALDLVLFTLGFVAGLGLLIAMTGGTELLRGFLR